MTRCRDLREGINFQAWFHSSLQHFLVCFVSSELQRTRRRLTKTIARSKATHLSVKHTSAGRSEKVAAISQNEMENVSSEKVEDLPLEAEISSDIFHVLNI